MKVKCVERLSSLHVFKIGDFLNDLPKNIAGAIYDLQIRRLNKRHCVWKKNFKEHENTSCTTCHKIHLMLVKCDNCSKLLCDDCSLEFICEKGHLSSVDENMLKSYLT